METTEPDSAIDAYRLYVNKFGNSTFCHVHGSTVTVFKGSNHTELTCTTTDFDGQEHRTRISLYDVTPADLIKALAQHL
jgi:stress response protein SCP2